ncbi:21951_t:CDS:10 [Entrophospora sp. SA101]|nr:21951_t:CDS:10 [Entrophospora sp. SA101]
MVIDREEFSRIVSEKRRKSTNNGLPNFLQKNQSSSPSKSIVSRWSYPQKNINKKIAPANDKSVKQNYHRLIHNNKASNSMTQQLTSLIPPTVPTQIAPSTPSSIPTTTKPKSIPYSPMALTDQMPTVLIVRSESNPIIPSNSIIPTSNVPAESMITLSTSKSTPPIVRRGSTPKATLPSTTSTSNARTNYVNNDSKNNLDQKDEFYKELYNKNNLKPNIFARYNMVYSQSTQWSKKHFSFTTVEWGNATRFRNNEEAKKFKLYCVSNEKTNNDLKLSFLNQLECKMYPQSYYANISSLKPIQSQKQNKNIQYINRFITREKPSIHQAKHIENNQIIANTDKYIYLVDMKDPKDPQSYEILNKFGVDEASDNYKFGPAFSDNGYLALWEISDNQKNSGGNSKFQKPKIIMNIFNENEYTTNKITSCDSRDDGSSVICSTSDKGHLIICDYKSKRSIIDKINNAHIGSVTSCHYDPYVENFLLTSGADGAIKWWDTRKLKGIINNLPSPLHTFKKHIDTVNKVSWSPHIKSLFASCSDDKSVIIWNSVNIKEDNGIHFTHNLHRSKVVDFAWHPNPDYDRTIASISSGSETTSGLLQEQYSRVESLQNAQISNIKKAKLIESNIELVDQAILIIRNAIASSFDWKDLENLVAEEKKRDNPIANVIAGFKLEEDSSVNKIHEKVDVDIYLSAFANARKYYDVKKQSAIKQEKTLAVADKVHLFLFFFKNN